MNKLLNYTKPHSMILRTVNSGGSKTLCRFISSTRRTFNQLGKPVQYKHILCNSKRDCALNEISFKWRVLFRLWSNLMNCKKYLNYVDQVEPLLFFLNRCKTEVIQLSLHSLQFITHWLNSFIEFRPVNSNIGLKLTLDQINCWTSDSQNIFSVCTVFQNKSNHKTCKVVTENYSSENKNVLEQ